MLYIILPMVFGVLFIVGGITHMSKKKYLLQNGKVTKGIVFKMQRKENGYNPVVRFLTEDNEWITHEIKSGFGLNFYKEGNQIDIIYDPNDLTNIELHQPGHIKISAVLPLIIGIIFFLVGFYNFLMF